MYAKIVAPDPGISRSQSGIRWLSWVCCLVLLLLGVRICGSGQTSQPAQKTATSSLNRGLDLWRQGDYGAAITHFKKVVEADPDNVSMHTTLTNCVAGMVWGKGNELRQEKARAAQSAGNSQAKPGAVASRPGGKNATPLQIKTTAELAQMEKNVQAAKAAVAQLQQLYEGWASENPQKAVFPYALGLLTDTLEFDKREQHFLKAVAIDPSFTEAYSSLAQMNSTYDDHAAAEYARKAAESKPNDFSLRLSYARALEAADPAEARKVYRELVDSNKGLEKGATALSSLIHATQDRAQKTLLMEEYRRDYPEAWKSEGRLQLALSDDYVKVDPAKALVFLQECLQQAEENADNGRRFGPANSDWRQRVDFAKNLIEARRLMAARNYSQARALLERTKAQEDSEKDFELFRAELADLDGDTRAAYALVATRLVKVPDNELQVVLNKYGTKLGMTGGQMDADVWSRRMQKAHRFQPFELKRLGAQGTVKLTDLRGKVVVVDFWYPG